MTQPIEQKSKFLYERDFETVHIVLKGLTNHELRAVLVGLWLSLDADDRDDHIKELSHYMQPGSWPPPVSVQIAHAIKEGRK